MNHTPGPWITCGFENLTVNDSEGNTIIACPGSSTGTLVEMKANATFIVTACNAHEELVEMLNYAFEELNFDGTFSAEEMTRTIDIVRERIAKLLTTIEKGAA